MSKRISADLKPNGKRVYFQNPPSKQTQLTTGLQILPATANNHYDNQPL